MNVYYNDLVGLLKTFEFIEVMIKDGNQNSKDSSEFCVNLSDIAQPSHKKLSNWDEL